MFCFVTNVSGTSAWLWFAEVFVLMRDLYSTLLSLWQIIFVVWIWCLWERNLIVGKFRVVPWEPSSALKVNWRMQVLADPTLTRHSDSLVSWVSKPGAWHQSQPLLMTSRRLWTISQNASPTPQKTSRKKSIQFCSLVSLCCQNMTWFWSISYFSFATFTVEPHITGYSPSSPWSWRGCPGLLRAGAPGFHHTSTLSNSVFQSLVPRNGRTTCCNASSCFRLRDRRDGSSVLRWPDLSGRSQTGWGYKGKYLLVFRSTSCHHLARGVETECCGSTAEVFKKLNHKNAPTSGTSWVGGRCPPFPY